VQIRNSALANGRKCSGKKNALSPLTIVQNKAKSNKANQAIAVH